MRNLHRLRLPCPAGLLICLSLCASLTHAAASRTTLSLDDQWEIAEGGMGSVPAQFERRVPVPGLVDEARPPFSEVGAKSAQREAFWYRRTFKLKGDVPAVALLKVHKAAYGSRVFLPRRYGSPRLRPGGFAFTAPSGPRPSAIRCGS